MKNYKKTLNNETMKELTGETDEEYNNRLMKKAKEKMTEFNLNHKNPLTEKGMKQMGMKTEFNLSEDVGSPLAKKIYRNSKVREKMMKWKKMAIIDFLIEREDKHKEFIRIILEDIKKSNEEFSWDSMKPIIIKKIKKRAGE